MPEVVAAMVAVAAEEAEAELQMEEEAELQMLQLVLPQRTLQLLWPSGYSLTPMKKMQTSKHRW